MAKQYLKKIKFKIATLVGPFFIYFLLNLIFFTCRKKYQISKINKNQQIIILFWHGEFAMMPFVVKKKYPERKVRVIISNNKDGEIITRAMKLFNIGAIRGSSSKNACNAFKSSLQAIEENCDVVITPDGPRGPRHSMSDSPFLLSSKKNIPIVVVNYGASRKWQFKSWDKFFLPKPFSTIEFFVSEPFYVGNLTKEEGKQYIRERLLEYSSEK